MRAYFLGNYYLSPIQQGIQALHCAVDMRSKYPAHPQDRSLFVTAESCAMYTDWSTLHKTVVLLNGGNQQALIDLYTFLDHPANPYPFGYFREDNQSLNDCITCVGIILPEKIYEGAALLRDRRNDGKRLHDSDNFILVDKNGTLLQLDPIEYTKFELELMTKLNDYRLA